jgi:hypothetical protein
MYTKAGFREGGVQDGQDIVGEGYTKSLQGLMTRSEVGDRQCGRHDYGEQNQERNGVRERE